MVAVGCGEGQFKVIRVKEKELVLNRKEDNNQVNYTLFSKDN